MEQLKFIGGARIGMAHATWPFATLTVTNDRLDLNVTIIGNYSFLKDDIISIEPYFGFPIFGQGIKINHKVKKYSKRIIFMTFKNADDLINEIKLTGFFKQSSLKINNEIRNQVIERQKQGGFPIRVPIAIAIVIIWNIPFIYNYFNTKSNQQFNVKGAVFSLGFILIVSILTLISKDFRKIILKDGRELNEISKFIYFLIFISVSMLMMITISGQINN